ncbi:MAG: hypothetical protein ACW963_07245 [Candidatus Sifarchaeia archaeon]
MVQQIAVIREGGVCAFNRSYWQLETNPELLCSFISAISEFVRCSFGLVLEEFKCQDYRTFIFPFENNHLIVITVDDRNTSYEILKTKTLLLAQQIWKKFFVKLDGIEDDLTEMLLIEQLYVEIDELVGMSGTNLESDSEKLFEDILT